MPETAGRRAIDGTSERPIAHGGPLSVEPGPAGGFNGQMAVYVEAHGSQTGRSVFVPENLKLHFYAPAGETASAAVTLLAQAGVDPAPTPVQTVCGAFTDNNSFSELEPQEMSYSMSIQDPSVDVRYVGADSQLPAGVMLCSRLGRYDCAEDRVRLLGRHTCRGVLGVLHDAVEIHLLICRSSGRRDPMADPPPNTMDFFANLDAMSKEILALIRGGEKEQEEAWQKLNELYGTPDKPVSEVKAFWASLDDAGRASLIESQRNLILMMNRTAAIQNFLNSYGDRKYFKEAGEVAFYAYYLAADDSDQKRIEAYLAHELRQGKDRAAQLSHWLLAENGDPALLDGNEYERLLTIDGYEPGQPVRNRFAKEWVTTTPVIDWSEVAQKSAGVLKEALVGEYAWFIGKEDDTSAFLFETTPEETIAGYAEKKAYQSHWATRAYADIQEDDNHNCGVTVTANDGTNVRIALIQASGAVPAAVGAAVDLLNATGGIAVTIDE